MIRASRDHCLFNKQLKENGAPQEAGHRQCFPDLQNELSGAHLAPRRAERETPALGRVKIPFTALTGTLQVRKPCSSSFLQAG